MLNINILTFNEYIDEVNKMIADKMNVVPYNNYESEYVTYTFRPLNFIMSVCKTEFEDLYALCASMEYGYYHIHRIIINEFSKVLFKKV